MSACIKLRRAAQVSAVTGSLEHDSICNQCSHSFQQNCVVSTPYSLKLESLNLTSRKLPLHVSLHFSVFFHSPITIWSWFVPEFNLKETFASSVCLIGSDMAKDCNQRHLEASTQIKSRRQKKAETLLCSLSDHIWDGLESDSVGLPSPSERSRTDPGSFLRLASGLCAWSHLHVNTALISCRQYLRIKLH